MVNIRRLKDKFAKKYPGKAITAVLINEPDDIPSEDISAKMATWQAIVDTGEL